MTARDKMIRRLCAAKLNGKTTVGDMAALVDGLLVDMKPTLEMAKQAPHYHDSEDGVRYMNVFTAMIQAIREGK